MGKHLSIADFNSAAVATSVGILSAWQMLVPNSRLTASVSNVRRLVVSLQNSLALYADYVLGVSECNAGPPDRNCKDK